MRIVLDMPFVSLNKYINAERTNKFIASNIKRQQTQSVALLANKYKLEKGLYNVHFEWHKPNNRTDNDNISFSKKFILDGFVKSGTIENDTPNVINNFTDTFILDKSRNYVYCIASFEKVL